MTRQSEVTVVLMTPHSLYTFDKKGVLCGFILAGATDESKKLMQYKLVVNISRKS